mmetsp:Transcript_1528/g.1753  ORF Transcript_1528/g.1753 Transcript_1528/m.1753 type:complete len:365 (-) Transcript_1528:340-1434(-)
MRDRVFEWILVVSCLVWCGLSFEKLYSWSEENKAKSILPTTAWKKSRWPVTTGRRLVCETCQGLNWIAKMRCDGMVDESKDSFAAREIAAEEALDITMMCELGKWEYHANRTEIFLGSDMQHVCLYMLGKVETGIIEMLQKNAPLSEMVNAVCVEQEKICDTKEIWAEDDIPPARHTQIERNFGMSLEFMQANKGLPGITEIGNGILMKAMKLTDSPKPIAQSTVLVAYNATWINGISFDNTENKGGSANIKLTEMMEGVRQCMMSMREGEDKIFYVPPYLAWSVTGMLPFVGPNMAVLYRIHLIEIVEGGTSEDFGETEMGRFDEHSFDVGSLFPHELPPATLDLDDDNEVDAGDPEDWWDEL